MLSAMAEFSRGEGEGETTGGSQHLALAMNKDV